MMCTKRRLSVFALGMTFSLVAFTIYAQESYVIKDSIRLKTTSVKNQQQTGTCWSFATLSYIESELLRLGKEPLDLSEMYMVRLAYPKKADKYIRLKGKANFSSGGQAHDVIKLMKEYGIVPEEVYTGLLNNEKVHNHDELSLVLDGFLKSLTSDKLEKISPLWKPALEGILNAYLGVIPAEFDYKGKKYSPQSFAKTFVNIDLNNYIEFTSFSHQPFYENVYLEIPDNWDFSHYYNVPFKDLIAIVDNALINGYTVCWDGDVSERSFSQKEGIATIPLKNWSEKSDTEKESFLKVLEPEKVITQEMRQKTFDNFTTTDDHLMHLVGMAFDQHKTKYYIIKNSWGQDNSKYNGYLYMSEAYFALKTIAIMVNKQVVPTDIKKKLNL